MSRRGWTPTLDLKNERSEKGMLMGGQPSTISELRQEAEAVKKCFTDFSFQAMLFVSAAFGLILANKEEVVVLFGAYLVPPVMIAIGRIGTYKYATANRIYGFQLCLERRLRTGNAAQVGQKDPPLPVGWEEAMGAWRVVQASVFEALYRTRLLTGNPRTERNRNASSIDAWWDLNRVLEDKRADGVTYYAGSYLTTMLALLYACVAVAMGVLLVACVEMWRSSVSGTKWPAVIATGLCVLLAGYSARSAYFVNQRRRLLESKILSIAVCATVWELVLAAHERADRSTDRRTCYTRALAAEVAALLEPGQLERPEKWLRRAREMPPTEAV
jgi:hypothetical protein